MSLIIEKNQNWNICSLEFSDYEDIDAKMKDNDFLSEYSSTVALLSFENSAKDFELAAAEKWSFH